MSSPKNDERGRGVDGRRQRLPRLRALRAAAVLGLALGPGAQDSLRVQLLDNGDFREPRSSARDGRARRVPWWLGEGGELELLEAEGVAWLRTAGGARARQPVAGFAPLAEGLVVRGRVRGAGRLALLDGAGGRAELELGSAAAQGERFEIGPQRWRELLGRAPLPRFVLELSASTGAGADWSELEVLVPLPAPSAAELRAEIVEQLDWTFRLWGERGLDREGPRATGFFCHAFDCVSGERIATLPGGPSVLVEELLSAVALHADERWSAALERFLADYLELGFHPITGLPRRWDALLDQPLDERFVEVAADLRFLLDVHERGPERFRAGALQAARRLGEAVLARGVLPDGQVAAKYRPSDGALSLDVAPLRRLDVPAQLARLGAILRDERLTAAARNALAELEYAHHWPGTWDAIDPGFDDDLGHYGRRAMTMLQSHPEERAFANLVDSGWRHYAPLWRDALRFGGSIAADQVRCWELFASWARHDPTVRAELRPLLRGAARAHFKGEQYPGGAFGDVTFFRFDPRTQLAVGDLPGTPSNLLWGLALAYDASLELDLPELRAMYASVLRSSAQHYRRPYGYLLTQRELAGTNRGGGELRLLVGLVEMLRRL